MLLKIRKYFKFPHLLDKIQRSHDDEYAMQIILKLFPKYSYLAFTPFSLNPYTIVHILNEILLNNKKQIVEFGSGISTIIIARFIQINNLDINFLSIDNNSQWSRFIKKEMCRYGCEKFVNLEVGEIAELTQPYDEEYNSKSWYNLTKVKKSIGNLQKEIDLVIVDGPSTGFSEYARYPTIPIIKDYLSSNVTIFLDDTRRSGEKEILTKWNTLLNGEIQFEKMYGIIRKGECFSTKPLSH